MLEVLVEISTHSTYSYYKLVVQTRTAILTSCEKY